MKKLFSISILSLLAFLVSSNADEAAADSCLVNNHYSSHGEEEEVDEDISCPLESIQANGIVEIYAQNPSGEKTNLNIKKGTDLLIDGASIAGSLNTNAANISKNTTDISTNKTSIATNTTDIASNKTSIATNTTNIAANTAEIATYTDSIVGNTTAIAALGSDMNTFKASTNSQMNYMKSDYSSGIASAVAMSQFNLAQDGFSIGIGRGSYNDENETAFGLGYGGELKNGTLFKLQASKSGDASGVGLTISF